MVPHTLKGSAQSALDHPNGTTQETEPSFLCRELIMLAFSGEDDQALLALQSRNVVPRLYHPEEEGVYYPEEDWGF